jgi:hypothetical protein
MSDQQLFNILVTGLWTLGGWLLKVLYDGIKDIRAQAKAQSEKLAAMEVLVAGQYVRKDDLARVADAVFNKLDRIEAKIDMKADKP